MTRRLPQTPADYLVIGLSPALIMLLVGSLVFFLVEVFYQGEYRLRLSFILAMFVMATVCIARISMVEGAGYAFLFAVPLALVTFVAMASFVQVSGALAALSWLVNMFLIGLVWWCAHKLTWDCTLIDEKQDASGQGLLQTMGLDGDESAESKPKVKLPLWERWFGERKKSHAPGVWVVYFSLAALPLFGLGQVFISSANQSSRRYAFWLLLVYVASALALLLATSFLGLRRYLRQRSIEMPDDVAGVWVSVGSIMIVVLLAFCFLLPRPRAEYAVSQLPFEFNSPIKLPSRWGFGKDGPQDNKLGTHTGPQSKSGGQGKGSGERVQGSEKGKQGSGKSGQGSEKGQGSGEPGQGSGKQGQGADKREGESGSGTSGGSQQNQSSGTKPGEPKPGENESGKSGSSTGSAQSQANSQAQSGSQAQHQTSQAQATSNNSSPPSAKPSSFNLSTVFEWVGWFLGSVLKLAFYTVLAACAAYFAWRYRLELAAAFKKFIDELKALWARFFGRQVKAVPTPGDAVPAQPVYKRFADYADPFASGLVSRFTPAELVRYTFEAVEAWGREHNCPRAPQQTPHEYAEQLGRGQVALARDAGVLAELYCRAAYAAGALPDAAVQHVRQVWSVLRPAA